MASSYQDIFEQRLGPDTGGWREASLLLGVLCAAHEPLSPSELAEIAELSVDTVLAVQARLPELLQLHAGELQLDHALSRWLTREDESGSLRAGRFAVSLQESHARLRRWAHERASAGTAHVSPYLLRHLATHLDDTQRREVYARLLFERFEWSQAQLAAAGVAGLLRDTTHIQGHPGHGVFQALVRQAEPAVRRSSAQWGAQVLGRLGVDSSVLPLLVASARAWLSTSKMAGEALLPQSRSLRWLTGLTAVLPGRMPLAVLPDGRIVCAGDSDVRVYEPRPAAQPLVLAGHTGRIDALIAMPDGRVVTGSDDGCVRLWDLSGAAAPVVLDGQPSAINALAILPDGRVAAGGQDGSVYLWDVNSPSAALVLRGSKGAIHALAVLPDGRLATAGGDACVRLWDLSRPEAPLLLAGHTAAVHALAVLPDGRLVSGGQDQSVRVWDVNRGAGPVVLLGHRSIVQALAVLPDGRVVSGTGAFGRSDASVRVWDVNARASPVVFEGHTSMVMALAVLPDGRIASASWDGRVRVLDVHRPDGLVTLEGHTTAVGGLAVLADGRLVSASAAAAGRDDGVRIWDVSEDAPPTEVAGHKGPVTALGVWPDGQVVSGGWGRTLLIWDAGGHVLGHANDVDVLAVLPDGRVIVRYANDTVWMWDAKGCKDQLALAAHVSMLAMLPDGRVISDDTRVQFLDGDREGVAQDGTQQVKAAVTLPEGGLELRDSVVDHRLRVWDLSGRRAPRVLPGSPGHARALAILPDGRVASGGEDHQVWVWDVDGSAEPLPLRGHAAAVGALAVLPDGRLASGASDGSVRIWDVSGRTAPIVRQGHEEGVTALAALADGRVVSGSQDRCVRVWSRDLRAERCFVADATITRLAAPSASLIAAGCEDGTVHFLKLEA